MATNLHCPNCGESLGKDKECYALESCGNCGEDDIYNEYGDTEDMSDAEISKFNAMKRKRNKNSFRVGGSRTGNRYNYMR